MGIPPGRSLRALLGFGVGPERLKVSATLQKGRPLPRLPQGLAAALPVGARSSGERGDLGLKEDDLRKRWRTDTRAEGRSKRRVRFVPARETADTAQTGTIRLKINMRFTRFFIIHPFRLAGKTKVSSPLSCAYS